MSDTSGSEMDDSDSDDEWRMTALSVFRGAQIILLLLFLLVPSTITHILTRTLPEFQCHLLMILFDTLEEVVKQLKIFLQWLFLI
jgi:hypothetical protein